MKTNKNLIIFYDDQCPMCTLYSKWFVYLGFITPEGRQPFQNIYDFKFPSLDVFRARNEIALLDKESGAVTYGIDSLFKILQLNFPFLKILFIIPPFKWMMKRIYFLISYNRKVIAPAKKDCDRCVPDFSLKYRIVYLIFAWLVSSLILTMYSFYLRNIIPQTNFYREFLICGGQIVFQGTLVYFISKEKIWDYLGNMMTVSLAASFILFLLIPFAYFTAKVLSYFYLISFFTVVGLMFLEHLRRMKLLELSFIVSAGWVLYRILVLLIIL